MLKDEDSYRMEKGLNYDRPNESPAGSTLAGRWTRILAGIPAAPGSGGVCRTKFPVPGAAHRQRCRHRQSPAGC